MRKLEPNQIIIDDEEMDTLGTKIDQQIYLFNGKKYKLNGSVGENSNIYSEVKGDKNE